jgi:hypothetical protein
VSRAIAAVILLVGCGRIGFAPQSAYRAAVLADSPVGYWRLNDTGTVAADELGHTNGTFAGTCQHQVAGALAGDPDAAAGFDGVTCEIELSGLQFPANAPYTVELWTSEPQSGAGYYHYFTRETRSGGSPVDGFALFQASDAAGVAFERSVGGNVVHSPFATIPKNQYVYLVGTYDGARLELFVDAISQGTSADVRSMPTFAVTPLIGAHPLGAYFLGSLDEVAVYDHVLALDRIQLHHQIGVNGPP